MPAPKLKFIAIDDLTDDPKNARLHSDEQIAHVAGLVERFGWTRQVFVDCADNNTIVIGHGAKQVARHLYEQGKTIYAAPGEARGGQAFPKGKVVIQDVSGWTAEERRAVNLSDNRSAELSAWDSEAFAAGMAELAEADFTIADLGFDDDALKALDLGGTAPPAKSKAEGELADSNFKYEEKYAVIVTCEDANEQEARYGELVKRYGAENCRVVSV